jgi:hypothetical protein
MYFPTLAMCVRSQSALNWSFVGSSWSWVVAWFLVAPVLAFSIVLCFLPTMAKEGSKKDDLISSNEKDFILAAIEKGFSHLKSNE